MKIKYILLALIVVCTGYDMQGQTVTVIAGNQGLEGYDGDGNPATAVGCKMNKPMYVTHSYGGNIYFADYDNHVIRKIAPGGIITTIAGTGTAATSIDPTLTGVPATSVALGEIHGLAADVVGNLFFGHGNLIIKVTTDGFYTLYAGTGDYGNDGDMGQATAAKLHATALTFDMGGNLTLGMHDFKTVRRISVVTGIITTIAGQDTSMLPGDGGSSKKAYLGGVSDIEYDAVGNLYILSDSSGCVRKVNTTGIISTVAGSPIFIAKGYGGDGGPATNAKFSNPRALAVDNAGNIYISDDGNNRIRKVTPSDTIRTYAGTGNPAFNGNGLEGTATNIANQWGLTIYGGYLYFTEEQNALIRRISVNPPAAINELAETDGISVYPMPCGETFTIASELFSEPVLVAFTDVTGKVVRVEEISSNRNTKQYSTRGLAPGMYFSRVVSANSAYTLRLIKE